MPKQVGDPYLSVALACRCCGSSSTKALWQCLDEFVMRRCETCGAGFLDPFIAVEYKEGFYAPFITPLKLPWFLKPFVQDGRSFSSEWRYRKQLRTIRTLVVPANGVGLKLLDVGCGTGSFIRVAAESGVEAWGVETSAYAVQYCKTHHSYPVEMMERLSVFPVDFDVITLWHVLEHTADPYAFLKSVMAHLRPNGLMVIEVPNWDAWPSHCWRARWRHVRRDHLVYFTPAALRSLLFRAGLQPIRVSYTGSLGITPYLNKVYRWSGEAIKHWPPALPIKMAYLNLLSALRLGDFFRVYAVKKTVNDPSDSGNKH